MRKFADLHLGGSDFEALFRLAEQLGYSLVGAVASKQPAYTSETLTGLGRRRLEVVRRINLTPNSNSALLQMLKYSRREYEIIAVTCNSTSVARQAAKDHRVDLLNFPPENLYLFDEAEAELASNSNAALEVNFTSYVRLDRLILPKVLRRLQTCLNIASRYRIPIVTSSGAEDVYHLKPPRDMAAFMQLVGLDRDDALDSVSTTPFAIVERNQFKLSRNYVASGVSVVGE